MNHRHGHASDAQKDRPIHLGRDAQRLVGLERIGRHNHGEVGDGAGPGKILDGVMRGPQLAVGHAWAHPAQLDVGIRVGHVSFDLLERASGEKARGGAHERDLAGVGQSGGEPDHGLFGDTDVDQALGKSPGEIADLTGADRVVDHRTNTRIVQRHVFERFGESVATIEQGTHASTRCPFSSLSAWASSASVGTRWCQAGRSRMKETPWPLCVWAMMQLGLPHWKGS